MSETVMNDDDREFFDAYDAVELELPNGKKIRCKAPTLEESAGLLKLLQRVQGGDMEAMLEFIEEFPKAVDAGRTFNGLLPGELIQIANRFFWQTNRITAPRQEENVDASA